MNPEQERIRSLLVDTISLLCRNGLHFENELRVQAVVGVTVDKEKCFLVHINKCFERKTLDDEDCENEEQQEIAATSEQSQQLQPTRPAPTAPSEEANKIQSASQDLSPSDNKQNNSQQQQPVTDNSASKSDAQIAKQSRHESLDDCEELLADSDDCSVFMTDMPQQRYYNSSQPTKNKLRSSFDGYRPKTKRQNLNDDFFDGQDDYCSDFNVGQQYMYIDSGRSRARPKVSRKQHHDVPFSPQCTPSMMAYGTQDVRLLVLTC